MIVDFVDILFERCKCSKYDLNINDFGIYIVLYIK